MVLGAKRVRAEGQGALPAGQHMLSGVLPSFNFKSQ